MSQNSTGMLNVVSWNIEWFGDPSNGPPNADLQEANVKKILRYLDADLYGFCEVVDTMRFRRVVDSLGSADYGFFIAPYCSGNSSGSGASWLTGQKLGFIYRKNMFSNIRVRGMLRNSTGNAYYNWATGRFPYLLTADVTIYGITKNINFIVIHGKSGSTSDDYDRRKAGAQELKDSLDANFSNSNVLVIGDYNDALNRTISSGSGPESSYISFVADSAHYKSLTLPLAVAGQTSMIDFPNVIDNHVISASAYSFYVPNSVRIRTDVTTVVSNYTSNNTSDHYPVYSQYNIAGIVSGLPNITPNEMGIAVYPNPFNQIIYLQATKTLTNVQMKVYNSAGQMLNTQFYSLIREGAVIQPPIPVSVSTGIYFLTVETKQYKTLVKLVRLQK